MTTAIEITEKSGEKKRLLFCTVATVGGIDVDVFLADEDFIPLGKTSIGVSPTITDEEEYHRKLRIESQQRNQFVPEFSTDPELSPGYVAPVDNTVDSDMS